MYTVVIRNGQIVDGCGNPWFRADIGIKDGRIAFIGRIDGDAQDGVAQRVLDATGLVVAPGFVDIHTHSDTTILSCPTADSKFTQGITTEVGGNCGYSLHPVTEKHKAALEEFLSIFPGKREYRWSSAAGFLDEVSRARPSGNFATLIGHSAIRLAVKGWDKSPATPEELKQMENMAEQGLEEGCVGVSFGLPYPPGSFASDEEILSLMTVAARKSRLVTVHVRDEADHCVESVQWVIDAARKTGAAVEISHLKSMGKPNWGKVLRSLEIISEARATGVDITVDVYPYVAINTTLTSLLPGDVISGGIEEAAKRLQDRAVFGATVDHLARNAGKYGGWENVIVASVSNMADPGEVEGISIKDIAGKWGMSPEEAAIRIATESRGSTMIVCFSMSEDDVIAVYKAPFSMAGSDGKIQSISGPLSVGRPHPRNYGAFPRIISWLVREKKALTIEEAIRKMTSLPAQRMGFRDRGAIRPGNWADLTIFSLDEIRDMATFKAPHQYSSGIKYMLVNGEVSLENGKITGRAGQVLS